MIRSTARKFLAKHWNDFFAEQVELLQHHLQRKAGVIDEEQLPLIVAGIVAEAQRAIDDLLRRTDGQRCLGSELLQTRAVPVHRSIVEIGSKLRDGILTVGPHEDLPAETNDRLIGAA